VTKKPISIEILRILEYSDYLSSQELFSYLKNKNIATDEKKIRYTLNELHKEKKVKKVNSKWRITEKGIESLNRAITFERAFETHQILEYNLLHSTFDLYNLEGTVPTIFTTVDKDKVDLALELIYEVFRSGLSVSNRVCLFDEEIEIGGVRVPEGLMGIGVVSSLVHDVIMLNIGLPLNPEYAGLIEYKNSSPSRVVELINYKGTTINPGTLLLRGGYTSVNKICEKGEGNAVIGIRTFSRYGIFEAEKEAQVAKSRGICSILAISHPGSDTYGFINYNRGLMILSAGINQFAPMWEMGFDLDLKLKRILIDFKLFKKIDSLI